MADLKQRLHTSCACNLRYLWDTYVRTVDVSREFRTSGTATMRGGVLSSRFQTRWLSAATQRAQANAESFIFSLRRLGGSHVPRNYERIRWDDHTGHLVGIEGTPIPLPSMPSMCRLWAEDGVGLQCTGSTCISRPVIKSAIAPRIEPICQWSVVRRPLRGRTSQGAKLTHSRPRNVTNEPTVAQA